MNTYEEALQWIHSRLPFGVKPGLKRMEWMLQKLGNPERRIKTVHIAGTNGKGSTTEFIRNILQKANYNVGTFTSPYIEQFNERIRMNGLPISDDDLIDMVNVVKPLAAELDESELGSPTEFELLTVMAIQYFATVSYPDIVIVETGLGGRLDSTNVIHPLVSVITTIGHDHMHILGDSLEEITREKAGIIKSGVPVVTGVNEPKLLDIIETIANEKRAKFYVLNQHYRFFDYEQKQDGEQFSFTSPFAKRDKLFIKMIGIHQVQNASAALMVIDYLKSFYSFLVDPEHIVNGLAETSWIGRFEQVSQNPRVIIDGAHNREGITSLVHTIEKRFNNENVSIIFAALKDKDTSQMINELESVAHKLTLTTFDFLRASSAERLAEIAQSTEAFVEPDWKEAIQNEMRNMSATDVLIVTGSLYFISDVRKYFT
jgi:dihydrofolate synthase / folylpolyglutamate synthase